MANQKTYYYVLVFTGEGPVYVTSVNNADRWAQWDKSKKPKLFQRSYAEELVLGLTLNGHNAVMICSKFEQYQPYNYDEYTCKFIEKV